MKTPNNAERNSRKTPKFKRLPNEFHRKVRLRGGHIHRNKKKYHRPSEKRRGRNV